MFANVDGLLDALAEALGVETVVVEVSNTPSNHEGFVVKVGDATFTRNVTLADGLKAAVAAARAGAVTYETAVPAEDEEPSIGDAVLAKAKAAAKKAGE